MHLLQQSGIDAHVFNENAQGGIGQLPFTEAYPEVWIERENDLLRARDIVAGFDAQTPDVARDRSCARCGQSSPDSFDLCWNCGVSF